MASDVSTPSTSYRAMEIHRLLPRTLYGGTMAMQTAGPLYLPREAKEGIRNYNNRLARSVLFPAFKQTVQSISSKPFVKPAALGDKADQDLFDMVSDVDLTGRDLSTFAQDIFADALIDGMAAILVDYPNTAGQVLTLAQQQAQEIRPYFVPVQAQNLIEVKTERRGGQQVIVRARIREEVLEPDGDYGDKLTKQVRVIYEDRYEVWRADDKNKGTWMLTDQTLNTLGKVPLVPLYTGWISNWFALPAMEDLAYLNLKHWMSQSDQDNILHVARVPILFGAGWKTDDAKALEIGASSMIRNEKPDAKLMYVEHSGAAIGAGHQSLTDLKQEMSILGYEPLVAPARSGDITATARAIDMAEINSRAQAWARGLEVALEAAFEYASEWNGKMDTTPDVKLNTEFGLSLREAKDLDMLLQTRKNGDLSQETYWSELRRRGILPDEFDPAAEKELLAREPKPLAFLSAGGGKFGAGGGDPANSATGGIPGGAGGGKGGGVQPAEDVSA